MTAVYFCVRVPEFSAQACLRLRPELASAAVAVLSGEPPLEEVCSVNTAARRLGVTERMTRAELESFVELEVLRRSTEEERVARAALLETAGAFTPRVQVWSASPSGFVMVLDMTGTALIFGQAEEAAERVSSALSQLKFFTGIAVSANFHTAICAARAVRSTPLIIPPGDEAECLAELPLAVLSLTPQEADTMALWGLRTLRELAELPEVELVVRLGQEGKRLRLLARGQQPHLMVPEEVLLTLDEFIAFDTPIELLDSLLFVIGPMLDYLLLRAGNHSLALASITLTLGLDGGGTHARTVQPALPVLQKELLLKLLHLDLQTHPPGAGVLNVHVHAEPGDRSKVQLGLFAPQLPESSRLDVALARISALVGEGRAGRARLLDANRPDSFLMERFIVSAGKPKQLPTAATTTALRRCRPPLDIHVQSEGQRIAFIAVHGKRYTVREVYGPWRDSGDWWTADAWSREEWDLVASRNDDETLLCRVVQNRLTQQWQLEALYD